MALEGVLKYLSTTNRPYSANDIVSNSNKQWGKTEVQKALDSLVAAHKVIEKVYGKQKVYVVRQVDEDPENDDMKDIDTNLRKYEQELKETKESLKAAESELKNISSSISTTDALHQIDDLKPEIEKLKEKLEKLSENSNPISPEELEDLKKQQTKFTKDFKSMKRICLNILDNILESYPKTKKQLIEELGIQTDEDAEFTLVEM